MIKCSVKMYLMIRYHPRFVWLSLPRESGAVDRGMEIRRFVFGTMVLALSIVGATSSSVFGSSGVFRTDHGQPLNNLSLTPGATFKVSAATICRSGYSRSVRDVPESEKKQVYREYGIIHRTSGEYEVDHLISLELGGNNAIGNLWPELNDHPHGYLNSKDILENRLHALVCSGQLGLKVAQSAIAKDWVSAYHRYLGVWPAPIDASVPTALVPTTTPVTTTEVTTPHVGIQVLSAPISVEPGETATLRVHSSMSNDHCSLNVTLPSGTTSQSQGLGATIADASGSVVWSWLIGTRTGAGVAHLSVSCEAGGLNLPLTIS